jgi:uncharacterized protein (UPF0335 family)
MAGSRGTNDSVDNMMNDILTALEIIKKQLPNGELKAIQERIERIDQSQEDMKEDLRAIKRQLLDPEDGIIVRVNKNTEFRKKQESEEKDFDKFMEEHKDMMSFKDTVTKILWIVFTAIAGIILAMIFGVTK